ncbi:etoposide-induced protein 2.4-domain-containing protein [Schizophyllum commune]
MSQRRPPRSPRAYPSYAPSSPSVGGASSPGIGPSSAGVGPSTASPGYATSQAGHPSSQAGAYPPSPGFPSSPLPGSSFPASPSAGFPSSPSFPDFHGQHGFSDRHAQPGFPASPSFTSARASYPKFLSLQDTILLQLRWAWHGLRDAFRWELVYGTVMSDQEVRANIVKSLLLNSLSLASIYGFDLLLAPLLHGQTRWVHRNVGWFYQALWLLPVVGVSFYLNSTWCTLIAKRTFALQHGSRAAASAQQQTYAGMLRAIATSAYRGVMVITSIALSLALGMIPRVGRPLELAFLCWVDAYYCFEFVWIARNMGLARRVRYLEERWAYFFAFGLPASLLCNCGTGLANGAIFALVFPMYIIMAMHARPTPGDPYNPAAEARHPSPFVPIRLRVFAPVMWLNDWVVRVVSVGGGGKAKGHKRGMSEGETETLEQGEVGAPSAIPGVGRGFGARTATSRVQLGRRKAD